MNITKKLIYELKQYEFLVDYDGKRYDGKYEVSNINGEKIETIDRWNRPRDGKIECNIFKQF